MKLIYKLFPILLIILTLFVVSCNLQTDTTFPGNGINQIEISSIQISDKDGNAVNSIVRGNTVLISLDVKNYENTYTLSYYVKENTGVLTQISQNKIIYLSSYKGGTYHIYISATDDKNTATAVCSLDVLNRAPEIDIDNALYSNPTTGNNTITIPISDPDSNPATILNVYSDCDTGVLSTTSGQITNSGPFQIVWQPTGVIKSTTINISITVVDDNPNTTTGKLSFYYNKP